MVYKRRRYRKRGGTGRYAKSKKSLKSTVPRNLVVSGLGFPKKFVIKQKYYQTVEVASTGGAISNTTFALNDMFLTTSVGSPHKPYYFNQLSALYNHFTVVGAKVTVMVTPAPNNTVMGQVALWQNDDTTVTPTSFYAFVEQSKGKVRNLPTTMTRPTYLTLKWSAKKTFGGTVLANPNLQGSGSASPAEKSYATLSFQTVDAATTTSIRTAWTIEYIAVWRELKDIAGST